MNGTHAPPQFFSIDNSQLTSLRDKVILITGGSSGIGLATAELCLDVGAKVVVGDVNKCPINSESLVYQQVDVRDWKSQTSLFKKAVERFGRVDHVFANAGVACHDRFVEDKLDDNGDLLPPDMKTLDINLTGCLYTCRLGLHYIGKNGAKGGSVVITASVSSFMPFFLSDYGVSKHAVLGLMRALHQNLTGSSSLIRINCVTPMWTATGLVPAQEMKERAGITSQGPDVVARSVSLLMADEGRKGQTVYSIRGKYKEVEGVLLGAAVGFMEAGEEDMPNSPEVAGRMMEMLKERRFS